MEVEKGLVGWPAIRREFLVCKNGRWKFWKAGMVLTNEIKCIIKPIKYETVVIWIKLENPN